MNYSQLLLLKNRRDRKKLLKQFVIGRFHHDNFTQLYEIIFLSVLKATCLTLPVIAILESIVNSWEHGVLRAAQGFTYQKLRGISSTE